MTLVTQFIPYLLDQTALRLARHPFSIDLPRNRQPVGIRSLASLPLVFAPGISFAAILWAARGSADPRYAWLRDVAHFPWQFWTIALLGAVATAGGVGDWWYHKVFVAVGPREHHSHMLALGMGVIVFFLMALASSSHHPSRLLIPIIVALIVTVALISYDEFVFHIRRCRPFETLLHRMLVMGNGAAFLCWMHWLFVDVSHG